MITRIIIAVLAAQCLLCASLAQAQEKKDKTYKADVWGYLVDDMTGAPVVGAKVTIMSAKDSTVIDPHHGGG